MQRLLSLVTLVALIGVGWFVAGNFKIEGLDNVSVKPREKPADTPWSNPTDNDPTNQAALPSAPRALPAADHRGKQSIRIASFNIQV